MFFLKERFRDLLNISRSKRTIVQDGSIYEALDALYGRKPVKQAHMSVQAIGASAAKASALQISVGEPLLYTTMYAVDQFEKPIYIGRQYYVGSRYMLDL